MASGGGNAGKMRGHRSVKGGLGSMALDPKQKDNFLAGDSDYASNTVGRNTVSNRGKSQSGARGGAKMSAEVLETWINETLQDAEHLDIPGVILKPEHKDPISRYGIDRLVL